jgi:hypothetical protein
VWSVFYRAEIGFAAFKSSLTMKIYLGIVETSKAYDEIFIIYWERCCFLAGELLQPMGAWDSHLSFVEKRRSKASRRSLRKLSCAIFVAFLLITAYRSMPDLLLCLCSKYFVCCWEKRTQTVVTGKDCLLDIQEERRTEWERVSW